MILSLPWRLTKSSSTSGVQFDFGPYLVDGRRGAASICGGGKTKVWSGLKPLELQYCSTLFPKASKKNEKFKVAFLHRPMLRDSCIFFQLSDNAYLSKVQLPICFLWRCSLPCCNHNHKNKERRRYAKNRYHRRLHYLLFCLQTCTPL